MSGEILFKAKRKNWRELPKEEWWVEGYPVKIRPCVSKADYIYGIVPNYASALYIIKIDPGTLCQYTGLTDENGKRIWENDIVSNKWCFARGNSIVRYGEYKDFHMPEKYKCGNLGFYLCHVDKSDLACVRKDMMYYEGNCEIIGNIFDNPELLEEDGGADVQEP